MLGTLVLAGTWILFCIYVAQQGAFFISVSFLFFPFFEKGLGLIDLMVMKRIERVKMVRNTVRALVGPMGKDVTRRRVPGMWC